ncbi:MAG TPA: phosphodiesterase, partial [Acetobacteraceae bacterium]|nr:phosphodiesterase [Acetobacteraceae bacterium]
MLIAQLTDLHIRPVGKSANRVVETNVFTERALRSVAALQPRPDVVVITGDLTECGLDEEYANLTRMLRHGLSMPVFVMPGNHDRRGPLREGLAHLPGVTADPHFVQYVVEDYPIRLIVLDTLVPGAGHGDLCAERLRFLERALAAEPNRPTMIAMHHPPFACGIAHMDRINLRNADEFTRLIAHHPQVERIICGHVHRPVVTRLGNAIASIGPSVAHQVELSFDVNDPGCFLFEPPAYQLHRWTPTDG